MKKIIALILTVGLLLNIFNAVAETRFTDLDKNYWAYEDIMALTEKGIINGRGNGKFDPKGNIRVDEFIKICVALLEGPYDASKYDYWATPYINKAKELKLISSNEFKNYQRAITREEMASIAINTFSKNNAVVSSNINEEIISSITDYYLIDDYYKDNVLRSYHVGLIQGKPTKNDKQIFDPKGISTRAEATTVIMRIIDESRRTEFNFDIPYTMGYFTEWIEGTGWEEIGYKIYAPKTRKGEYETEPLKINDFLIKNNKNETSYYEAFYNPYLDNIVSYMTPFTYEEWFELGENDKVFHNDLTVTVTMPLFGKENSTPYNLAVSKHSIHAESDNYYEYLENHYKLFLDYFFYILFENDAEEVKALFKETLNNADGSIFIEESYVFNNRNVNIYSKNGINFYVSEKIQ